MNNDIKVSYKLTVSQIVQLHSLYQQEWWTMDRSLDETRRVVEGSQIIIGLINNNLDLVGFARVLTDYTFKALIFDIIVRRDQRGNGFGNKLLSLIKNHQELSAVKHFELYCRAKMFNFYRQHGFTTEIGEIQLMRLSNFAKS